MDGIIHGLRHEPEKGTSGWYIWGEEYSYTQDFFKPICVEHLRNYIIKILQNTLIFHQGTDL